MFDDLRVIIPARSGSVGVVDKNIQKVRGTSLLEYSILSALRVAKPRNILVSSDSLDYLRLCKGINPDVEVNIRPAVLSDSNANILDVISYVLKNMEDPISKSTLVLLLEPSHYGPRSNIIPALQDISRKGFDFALGVYKVPPKYNYLKQISANIDGTVKKVMTVSKNRQSLNSSYIRSGEFYLFNAQKFFDTKSFFSGRGRVYITPENSVNIDSYDDLDRARSIASKGDKIWR